MGDEHGKAALPGLVGGGAIVPVHAAERRLEEQPAAADGALGDRLELSLRQPSDHLIGQFAPGPQLDVHARFAQPRGQLLHPLGDLGRVDDVARVDVRGGDDRPGSVVGGGAGELEALIERRRAVVDAGKQVEVELRVVHAHS